MGDDAFGIIVEKFLRLLSQRLNLIQDGLVEGKLLQRFFVPLKQLDGVPAKILCRTASLNQVRDGVQNIFQLLTEDKGSRRSCIALCQRKSSLCDLAAAFSFDSAGLDDGTAQLLRQFFLGQSGRRFCAPNPSYSEQ